MVNELFIYVKLKTLYIASTHSPIHTLNCSFRSYLGFSIWLKDRHVERRDLGSNQ